MKTIFSERAAAELAARLTDPEEQLFWLERDPVMGGQALLRRAIEISGLEVRKINLAECWGLDLEDIFKALPADKPGIIILEEYDRADKFLVDIVTFTMLYYEYRRMISLDTETYCIPAQWKFVITTAPDAWIPSPPLHKKLCRIL